MNRFVTCVLAVGVLLGAPAFAASLEDDAFAAKKAGDFPRAIALFTQALALNPSNTELIEQLGTVQGWSGRYSEALRTFEEGLKLAPDDPALRLGRARILAWSGRYEIALAEVSALVEADPENHDAKVMWARIQSWRKEYDAAERAYRSVIAARPDSVDALEGLGDLQKWQDRLSEARDLYQRALEVDPQYSGLRRKLGSMPHAGHWRLDLDYEYSAFAGNEREDWNESNASLSHAFDKRTSLAFGVVQARRFAMSDTQYGAVLGHRFDDIRTGYVGAAFTPDAGFLAKRSLSAGGSWKVHETGDGWPATFVAGDYRVARYGDHTAQILSVGPQYHATRTVSGTARVIASRGIDGSWKGGGLVRVDIEPIKHWNWSAGYIDAAESLNASAFDFSARRRTRAVLLGWTWEFSPVFAVRLDFAHEWAERTPDRNVWHVGTTTRF